MSWPRDVLQAILRKPLYCFAIFLLGLLLLGLPAAGTDFLGVTALRQQLRQWIALVTVAAFGFWLVHVWPVLSNWWAARRKRDAIRSRLDALSERERLLLAYCVDRNRQTLLLELNEPWTNVAAGLCQKGLLRMDAAVADPTAWPHTIPDGVWTEVKTHRDILALSKDPAARASLARIHQVADGRPEGSDW